MAHTGSSGRPLATDEKSSRQRDSHVPRPIRRYLKHHYRDITALAYLLLVYPQMIDESQMTPGSPTWSWLGALWIVIALAGVAATMVKLRSLDPEIIEYKLERTVSASAQRFLAGFIALPLMITLPIFLVLGSTAEDSWLGPTHMGIGLVIWMLLAQFGRGKGKGRGKNKSAPVTSKRLARIATIVLVLFELHLYTIFLESLTMADEGFRVSMRSFLVLLLPMTGLFFMLFLPATVGFYIEECVKRRSRAMAAWMLWLKFTAYRFVPVYVIAYLEGQGVRVPWII